MKREQMKAEIRTWTPDMAKAVLSEQDGIEGAAQRKIRKGMVAKYVRDMKAGHWAITHQAIAIGPNGHLIDGQHRLAAIVESGLSFDFLTVRYATSEAALSALAATDIGGKRTVAEVLAISGTLDRDGARDVVAIVTALRMLLDKSSRPDSTPEEVRSTYAAHESHILWSVRAFPRKRYASPIRAAFAFAHEVYPDQVEEFAELVTSGVASAGSTAATWNRMRGEARFAIDGGKEVRYQVMLRALRLIRAHITGEGDLSKVYASEVESVEWFRNKAKRRSSLARAAE